jgi:divalent metal cation (Fe/Co/Zn/Cd) transporter
VTEVRDPNRVLEGSARIPMIRQAFLLEYITLGWMVIEAAVAIASGIAATSITLIAFGVDSVIELASACVLIWRLRVELRQGRHFAEGAERTASRIGGALLFSLAAYVIVAAGWSLWTGRGEEFSLPGFLVCAIAIPMMWVLSRRKLALATVLGSRALRTDAMESVTCGWLSLVVVFGLLVQLLTNAWWVDAVTSLAIVYFLVKEGREAWIDEGCCD